jgi:hypothetical protein
MSAEEFRYWQSIPENAIADQHAGFSDSVLPVYEPGWSTWLPMIMWSLTASGWCHHPATHRITSA